MGVGDIEAEYEEVEGSIFLYLKVRNEVRKTMKRLCVIPCGKKKIWDKYPDYGPMERKMYILARSEKHVNRMQLCFSRIGLYYQRSMDF